MTTTTAKNEALCDDPSLSFLCYQTPNFSRSLSIYLVEEMSKSVVILAYVCLSQSQRFHST